MAQDAAPQDDVARLDEVELLAANTVEFDEAELATASVAGDTAAFEALYTHYFPKVRGFCLRKLGNPDLAEDIAQEAFARAFERIADFGGPRHFGGWVGTIAANLCTDFLRRKRNAPIPLEDVETGPAYEVDPIRNLQREDTGRLVRLALQKLEPRHREALLLHEVKGLSCAAVGQRLGISEVAAESLLARARRRLRREITAKAAPADLFGLGGLGVLPALLRAWRRCREALSRRASAAQAAAARGWESVTTTLLPGLETAKALAVVVGAALVVEAAGLVSSGPSQAGSASVGASGGALAGAPGTLSPDGDLRWLAPGNLGAPLSASVDPATGGVDVRGGGSYRPPQPRGAELAPGVYVDLYLRGNGQDGYRLDARLAVGGEGGTAFDSGPIHEEVPAPASG